MNDDLLTKINESIHNTIQRLDEKATSLFTAIGIIFGLSSFLVETLITKSNLVQLVFIYVVGALYLLSFVTITILFVLLIMPRKKKEEELKRNLPYNMYSEDVYRKMADDDFDTFIKNSPNEETTIDQIKINSRISHTKELLMNLMVSLTILFSIFFVGLMILTII